MKKLLILCASSLLLASCTTQKPLYSWGKYEVTSYNYLKNTDEKSIQELMENYQQIIENQRKGSRGITPPGVSADYGYLLLQEGKTEEGKEMLMNEIALYPESKIFIERILKMIEE